LWATGRGTVQRKVSFPDGSKRVFVFKDSLLVPDLKYDLISTRRLDQEGFATTFSGGKGSVRDKLGVVAMFSQLCDGLYCVRPCREMCYWPLRSGSTAQKIWSCVRPVFNTMVVEERQPQTIIL
jgi:hypothetical protein